VCHADKQVGDFAKEGRNRNGRTNVCKICNNKRNLLQRKKCQKQGFCVDCNKIEVVGKSRFCGEHFFKRVATKHLKDKSHWEYLKQLAETQQYKCFYTGVELTPGVNMSLDHKISVYDEPDRKTDITNVHWVDISVNVYKNKMSHLTFIYFCKNIYLRFKEEIE
jgi:hypothetical protein